MALVTENPQFQRLSQAEQQRLGLPSGYKIWTPFPFAAMNQKDSKYAIDDKEFVWLENIIRQGSGFLRAAPDLGTPIYTASGTTVVFFFFYNIGNTDYCAIFLANGKAVQVKMSDLSTTDISAVSNTFYTGSSLPACVQWGAQYLVISNNNTVNDYWIWDGSILYTSGTLGPQVTLTSGGAGYTSAPTVGFFGGTGSGAAGTAIVTNGSVSNVVITNPGTGYSPNDIVQLTFTGGGSNTSAQLTAVLTSGTVDHINVTNPGSGYTTRPTIGFTGGGGGVGAAAHSVLTGTSVASVTVGAGGSGYTFANVIFSGGGGTGAAATAVITAGAVSSITMTSFGSGYNDVPTVTITGDGTLATATAHLTATTIAAVVVDTHGTGYTGAPAVGFTGGGGSSAAAVAVLSSDSVASVTINNGGTGFTSTPTLTFEGGDGTGAAATATITGGAISAVTVTNGGTGYTSAPTIIVQAGTSNAAAGTASVMPFGVNGNAMETFQSRIWVAHPKDQGGVPAGGIFQLSAPGSLVDFSIFDGGVIFQSSDSTLRKQYTNLKQSNGYLYFYGDSSAFVVSNVQTSGNPTITTFNYQNVDPIIGTSFRNTIQLWTQGAILSANMNGVFALRGGAIQRASEKVDNIFDVAQWPPTGGALTPSSATCYIHNVLYDLMLLTITDPFTNAARNVMLMWDGQGWYVGTQSAALTLIGTQTVNSDLNAYGTDGASVYPLFVTPSKTLQKFLVTKQYGGDRHFLIKQTYNLTLQGEDLSGDGAELSVVVNSEQGNLAAPYTADLSTTKVFTAPTEDVTAAFVGLTVASASPDFAIYQISVGYADYVGPIGSGSSNAPAGT